MNLRAIKGAKVVLNFVLEIHCFPPLERVFGFGHWQDGMEREITWNVLYQKIEARVGTLYMFRIINVEKVQDYK